jgi:capsular exopolysaccharide synthesis family protein
MGNVLRALKKSAQRQNVQEQSAVHVVSMAVAEAEQATTDILDGETVTVVEATPAPAPKATHTAVAEAIRQATRVTTPAGQSTEGPQAIAGQRDTAGAEPRVAPMRRSSYFSPLILTHHRPRCQVSEQIRQTRTALIRLAHSGPVRCMITSSQPREGKTVTAVNLAYTFSEVAEKKTLLIDADLRRGSVAPLLGMTRRNGLADLLAGACTPEEAIWSAGRGNFHVLTAGTVKLDEIGELLSGAKADRVMADLHSRYDFVVIDSPPVISVADAGILGRWADMAVLAVRIHKTHRDQVEQATQILEGVGVPVTGLIALDEKATGRKYYRYAGYTY